jgi:hypothetical protein
MPATAISAVLFALSVGLGIAAFRRRSRRLGVLSAASFAAGLAYTVVLLLGAGRM